MFDCSSKILSNHTDAGTTQEPLEWGKKLNFHCHHNGIQVKQKVYVIGIGHLQKSPVQIQT